MPLLPSQLENLGSEQSGVKGSSHEDVVDQVSGHPHGFTTVIEVYREEVNETGEEEGNDDCPCHQASKVLDQGGQVEEASEMKSKGDDYSGVEGREGVAVVSQRFVV